MPPPAPFQAFYLDIPGRGRRFCLLHRPPAAAPATGAAVLHIHAFAEELNRSRRACAGAARALAQAGLTVLQIDLLGCGDSSGEFAQATWADWLADIDHAAGWLRAQHPQGPLWLWGQRAGALLATSAAARRGDVRGLLLWQPVPRGEDVVRHWLRLKSAAALHPQAPGAMADAARARWRAGADVDIAGYRLTAALVEGLQGATLAPPAGLAPGRMVWLDCAPQATGALMPAAQQAVDSWRAAGWSVHAERVATAQFWLNADNDAAPALTAATVQALGAALQNAA